jgi:hypothetical protein
MFFRTLACKMCVFTVFGCAHANYLQRRSTLESFLLILEYPAPERG